MVHLLMLVGSLAGAIGLRLAWRRQTQQSWQTRWQNALIAFAVPALLLLSTAIALLWMGPVCHMAGITVHGWTGYLPHGFAVAYCGLLLLLAGKLGWDAARSHWRLQRYAAIELPIAARTTTQPTARLIPAAVPLIAQIGLWRPQLVVSQGLLAQLDTPHLTAVLNHEAAHRHYGDTVWFAAWGLLRRGSGWLPQTSLLWRELLLLRELRADRWAARQSDPLLLAEALYTVVSAPRSRSLSVGFNEALVHDRLGERVDALLANDPALVTPKTSPIAFCPWVGLALLPLMTIVLHH